MSFSFIQKASADTGSVTYTNFPLPTGYYSNPVSLLNGPDGALWFGASNTQTTFPPNGITGIGRMTLNGSFTYFPLLNTFTQVNQGSLSFDNNGNLWFTELVAQSGIPIHYKISRMTTSGDITEYTTAYTLGKLVQGSDGNMWFPEAFNDGSGNVTYKFAYIKQDGTSLTEFNSPVSIGDFTLGSDGNIWFICNGMALYSDCIGKINPQGVITTYPLPYVQGYSNFITSGPDGDLWFTEIPGAYVYKIGRMTTNGDLTEYTIGNPAMGITSGPDGNVWFTSPGYPSHMGSITPSGVVSEYLVTNDNYNSHANFLVSGNDKNIWVFESGGLGRIDLPIIKRQVEFVHGVKTSFTAIQAGTGGFQSLLASLSANQNYSLDIFPYYQDLGYRQPNGTCSPQPTPDTNTSPLSASGGIDSTVCDSQSAIAYNATGLDDKLSTYSSPVSIIGYSMGAATARGWLSLAQNRANDTTLNIVDTLITIQGAQQGSYLPLGGIAVSNALSWSSPIFTSVINGIGNLIGFDINRPALKDLTPISAWYQSVNATNVPSNMHYFNFYSDIKVSAHPQLFFTTLPSIGSTSFGDTVILPGDPNPNALPALGGARFLPGGVQAADRHEYQIASNHDVLLGDAILNPLLVNPLSLIGVALDVVNDSISHLNLNQHLSDNTLKINSCLSSAGQQTIQDEILRILASPAQACN